MTKANERTDKYWICSVCAERMSFKPRDTVCTVIMGLCGHCDRDDRCALTPIRDFIKPRLEIEEV